MMNYLIQVQFHIISFDVENYKKYVEMVFKYSNKFATFTEDFKENLNRIINSIYPIQTVTTTTTTSSRGRGKIFGR